MTHFSLGYQPPYEEVGVYDPKNGVFCSSAYAFPQALLFFGGAIVALSIHSTMYCCPFFFGKDFRYGFVFLLGIGFVFLAACLGPSDEGISFAEDIRPILKNKCMSCHGGVRQSGGLSFLFAEDLYDTLKSGHLAVIAGDPAASEVYKRITTNRANLVMPPEGERLTEKETELIRRWIAEGAEWEEHWAYVPPSPALRPSDPDRHPIDVFVGERLEEMDLTPAETADPYTLLRRVYLDLTGLPPSPEAQEAFAADPSLSAYGTVVDSLLASPHFGEKWASFWLDLARYADSQGYQKDHLRRSMWMYRDWVIDAFNQDMPLDSFTIHQLAGDLMEAPNDQQLLATAFHRNTMTNDEGGTDDEEFRIKAVIDRVNTTMEVWQGATFGCVQCHSHPYDPVRHESFYELKAYFNNTADADLTSDAPLKPLLSRAQKARRKLLEEQLSSMDSLEDKEWKELSMAIKRIKPRPVPIMESLQPDSGRVTQVFVRGNWLMLGDTVQPAVPPAYDKSQDTFSRNRLGLARWLMDVNNPLTGRVLANRIWAQLFGRGIVNTLEDFGVQGDEPTHPRLLDWLAVQLSQRDRWSLKSFLRHIVLSDTYRADSRISPEKHERDPDNRWLSRGPRFRLSAEQVRDLALTGSGLLNPETYGPSVMPYQPEGVWNVIRHVARWKTSPDSQAYRRALYTFHRRSAPYPTLLLFDAPSRESCLSRRVRTNTPLQALVTLNDPVYVEAARTLAIAAMEHAPDDPKEQITYAYRHLAGRPIEMEKVGILANLYEEQCASYQLDSTAMQALLPESEVPAAEKAAMVNVCAAILNLDEVLMKK